MQLTQHPFFGHPLSYDHTIINSSDIKLFKPDKTKKIT